MASGLIEEIVTLIQDETEGVPIRTVKSFMTKIPSVVTGADIVQWLMKNLSIEDPAEAMHIGSLIAAQGYFFPISDHVLTLKDDGTFYRFQNKDGGLLEVVLSVGKFRERRCPMHHISGLPTAGNQRTPTTLAVKPLKLTVRVRQGEARGVLSAMGDSRMAIYLCKRTMQNKTRLDLADYEAVKRDDGKYFSTIFALFDHTASPSHQENLARLQRAFARKWEFIYMQAEAQLNCADDSKAAAVLTAAYLTRRIDRKKDKTERKILDSQERAFWDVHRPVPGCVNTTEMDIRKCRRMKNPHRVKKSVYSVAEEGPQSQSPVHTPSHQCRKDTKEDVEKEIFFLNAQLDRHCLKMSKVAESWSIIDPKRSPLAPLLLLMRQSSFELEPLTPLNGRWFGTLISYTEQYIEYDPFVTTPELSNPWLSDDPSLWELEASKEPSQQRVKKWGFSLEEALKDPAGQELFLKFLESEFSSENLRFWLAVQDLKRMPQHDVTQRVEDIWAEFLAEGAPSPINLDSHSYERTSQNLKDPGRYSYEDAQDHIYKLMKSDSYARFLRSNVYQDLLTARKKPETEQGRRTSLEKFTRSVVSVIIDQSQPSVLQGKDGQTSDGPHAVVLTRPGLTRRKAQKNLSPVAKMWKKPPGRRVRSQYCHSGPPAGLDHLRGTDIMQ
ncbi:Regulator of G-protein signaling 6 [Takifugu flavidus]|uniref:Regulator of G-protein signaling 6 n=1 Tax=Takifugu flavidus TaxID=433684 RepID=A0A5C6NPV4_9TELE|nr:Regulator of G-protein signaling 6 [Takifugu flavidus]